MCVALITFAVCFKVVSQLRAEALPSLFLLFQLVNLVLFARRPIRSQTYVYARYARHRFIA